MDTWLLDLRFVWDSQRMPTYFGTNDNYKAGSSNLYFRFLSNVLAANASHRIIPIQTATSNGAMALIARKLRPQLMYIDASHANPDVFIDFENFYQILPPGGVMAFDDLGVPAVRAAFYALVDRYELQPTILGGKKAYVSKPRGRLETRYRRGENPN